MIDDGVTAQMLAERHPLKQDILGNIATCRGLTTWCPFQQKRQSVQQAKHLVWINFVTSDHHLDHTDLFTMKQLQKQYNTVVEQNKDSRHFA